jgi:hypothetical protein
MERASPEPGADMKRTQQYSFTAIFLLAALAIYFAVALRSAPPQELSEAQFTAKFQSNLIAACQVSYPPQPPFFVQNLRGTFYQTDSSGRFLLENGVRKQSPFRASFRISDDLTRQLLASTTFSVVTPNSAAQKLTHLFSSSK